MKKTLNPKKWISLFFICALALLVLLGSLMYIVDPFFQFRVRDNSYILNPRYVNAGLLKNYDYDTLVIGSSMTQNFDMELFRQELGAKPLHLSLGGITPLETVELMSFANEQGKAEQYYIGIDLHSFSGNDTSSTNPPYLFSSSPLSTAKYLLSYEAWFRFLPVDIGFSALHSLGVSLPPKFALSCSIDHLANWENDFSYGEDIVLSGYESSAYAVSEVETDGLSDRLEANLNMLLDCAESMHGNIAFFFPPYSSLYWYDSTAYIDTYLAAKEAFIIKADSMGFTVFDFQSSPRCADLNNYKDTTHYSGEMNDWMTLCFASGEHIVTAETAAASNQALRDNIKVLYEKYKDKLS